MLRTNAFSREQCVFMRLRKSSPSNECKDDFTWRRCFRRKG